MEKNVEIGILYDFYGELLTEKQRTILGYYYGEDLSLGEIAEIVGISRQAVHDAVRNAENRLRSYEVRLKQAERFNSICEDIRRALMIADSLEKRYGGEPDLVAGLKEIKEILEKIETDV